MKALAIVSGGLDSVTLAYALARENQLGGIVSFDYGQRHKKEITFAALAAHRLDTPHAIIDLTSITAHLKGSALTDNIAVPDGHYAEDSMKQTIVPNRNAMMLAMLSASRPPKGWMRSQSASTQATISSIPIAAPISRRRLKPWNKKPWRASPASNSSPPLSRAPKPISRARRTN